MRQDERQALLQALEEAGPFVLASPEDAEYFRKSFVKVEAPKPQPAPVIVEHIPPPPKKTEPLPVPEMKKPAPVVVEEPAAPITAPLFDRDLMRHMLKKIAPELAILDTIPNDAIARKIAERWKAKNQSAPFSILIYQEPPEQKELLQNIACAIDAYFGGARVIDAAQIEKDKQWDAFLSTEGLKWVLVCDYTLWQLGDLLQRYKETPADGNRTLGGKPLFLLPDLTLYLKDPQLKKLLWKALCQKLS